MRMDKRSSQRADLDSFVRHYFAQQPRRMDHGDKPDLVIEFDAKVIGLEHTRIYRTTGAVSGLEPHAQLAVQHHIVYSAWQEYSTLSSRKLWLLVDFDDVTTYKKRESQSVSSLLARVVYEGAANIPSQSGEIIWHTLEAWRYQRIGREFPKEVRRIDFQIVDDNPKLELWGPAYAYMVPHLSVESVKERILAKEKQLDEYLLKCEEAWLLIVVDTGVPSNHFQIDEELLATEFHTAFSKVLLYRSFHTEVFELKVLPKSSGAA